LSILIGHLYDTILWAGFLLVLMASVLMILSIGKGQRFVAVNEMRIYVQLEAMDRLTRWEKLYTNEDESQLLRSTGLMLNAAKMKVFRDLLCSILLVGLLLRWYVKDGSLVFGLVGLLVIYSSLWPSTKNFTIFSNVIAPVLQKLRRYRVTRETHVLLQLLRNEVQESQQRSVLYLIQKYQGYFKIINEDLILLEHEWRHGKDIALLHLQQRHPGNDEIAYLASMIRDMDNVAYEELSKMLKENSETLNKKQQSSYEARENDLNQILFMVNIAGTGLAVLWFVISMFLWSYSFDMNY
jgi:hypothetical protein